MSFFAFMICFVCAVTAFGYDHDAYSDGGYDHGAYSDGGSTLTVPDSPTDGISFDDLTVTVQTTLDEYRTVTDTYYNSVPVTLTEFIKRTVTLPTREVVRTPVNDVVRVSTVEVTRPTTETVTDVVSKFKCSTEVSTEFFTITHLDQNILQTTVTSTVLVTQVFHPTIVQTVILTEKQIETETVIITDTIWVGNGSTRTRAHYFH